MDKISVKLIVPVIEEQFDILLPQNVKIYNIIQLLIKAIKEFTGGDYNPTKLPLLYDRLTACQYDVNLSVREAEIENGVEIILM